MSRLFGDPKQLGIVVKDIHNALDHWINQMGVGPWFYNERVPFLSSRYHGEDIEGLHVSNAISHSGDWQIELVQPHHTARSAWTDFLDAGNEGLHHFSHYAKDFEATCREAEARGVKLVQDGNLASGRYAYFAHPAMKTTFYEIGEWTEERQRVFDEIKRIAGSWDGKDPIRHGSPPV